MTLYMGNLAEQIIIRGEYVSLLNIGLRFYLLMTENILVKFIEELS